METATRQGLLFEGSTKYIRGTIDLLIGPSLARKRKSRRGCRERAKQILARLRRTQPAARTVEAPDMRDGDIQTSGATGDADAMIMATSSSSMAITDGTLVKVVSGRHLGLTGVARGRVSRSTVAMAVELPDPSQLRKLMVAIDQLEVAACGPAKTRQCIAKATPKAPMHVNRKRLWDNIPGLTEDVSGCAVEAQQHTSEMERKTQTLTASPKLTATRSQHMRRGSVPKDCSPYPTAWGSQNCGVVRSSFKAIEKGFGFGDTEGRSDDDMGDTGTDCVTPGPSLGGSEFGAGHSVEMEGITPDRPRSGSFSSLYSDWSSDSDVEEERGDVLEGGEIGEDAVFPGGSSCGEDLREGPRRLSVDGSRCLECGLSQQHLQLQQRVLRSAPVKSPSPFISRCLTGVARGATCSGNTRTKGGRGRAMVAQSESGTRWRRPRPPPISLELDDVDSEKQVCGLMNATKVMENLWVSGQEATTDKASLQREGVTHIVNCSQRLPDFYPEDFFYHRVRWADECGQDVNPEVLKKAFGHIDAARSAGKACLVHCQAGMSRSCALVVGYLMQLGQGMSLAAAFEFCQSKRPQCFPDKYFLQKLSEYEESLFGQTSVCLDKYCRGDHAHSILIENK